MFNKKAKKETADQPDLQTMAAVSRKESRSRDRKAQEKRAKKASASSEASDKKAAGSSRSTASSGKGGKRKGSRAKVKSNDRRNIWLLIITTLLVIGSIAMFMPPDQKINQGLDIQGGLSVVLTASENDADGGQISQENLEKSRSIIENRVNALGASETSVQVQGNNQILVQIPGMTDAQTALQTIGKTGKLEFARLDSFTDQEVVQKIENNQYGQEGTVTDSVTGTTLPSGQTQHLKVKKGTYTPIVTGENITRVSVDRASDTSQYYAVNITLDQKGTDAFAKASKDLVGDHGQIVILLDGEVQSAPAVQAEITNGQVSITGNYTQTEAQALQTVLESGSLPVSFTFSQSSVVGPTLGQGALGTGVLVALIGLIVVMVYLMFFYKGLGLINAGAIGIFAVLYLGILATLSHFGLFSLSLSGVAGIVLTIGMAADSSVLTVERFREEIRMGRSVRAASITGVRHAIQTSIDADLVSLVSALCLFFLASASVKGFGMTLALGIGCDIVMMLIFKAPLIRLLAPRAISKHPGFWNIRDSQHASEQFARLSEAEGQSQEAAESGYMISHDITSKILESRVGGKAGQIMDSLAGMKGRFIRKDINFLGVRKAFLTISAVLVACSFVVFGVKGLNLGIEFVGGTSITFNQTGDTSIDQMRQAFQDAGVSDPVVQTTETNGQNGMLVRTTDTSAENASKTASEVAKSLNISADDFSVDTIGPDWGASVIQSSAIAFVVSMLLVILYVAIRFEYRMGVMAVVALLHDLIIVVGVYALVGREVNPNTVAALLTILGYSLYDTVVVFHRIDDNMKNLDVRCSFMTMANHSINQVFVRTINTSLTSLIPVLAMLFFGSETLKDFAFAMAIGLIAGSYSSIGVASPLYAMWKSRMPENRKLTKRYGAEVGNFSFKEASWAKPVVQPAEVAQAAAPAQTATATVPAPNSAEAAQRASTVSGKTAAEPAKPQDGGAKKQGGGKNKFKSNHHYRKKQ
jgi:SecD/SecF fusion protein